MYVDNAPRTIQTNTTGQRFQIASSARAFSILADKLYSRKIGAPVRELITNGYDAHVRAGKTDVPLKIHVGGTINPSFAVRDYGNSMTPEQVVDLYTTLFGSDKTATNSEVGAFGLGAKSPFAYTDSFALTCYDGENARSYVAFIDEQGFPTLSDPITVASKEPRGTEVAFAIKPDDENQFWEETVWQCCALPVMPVVTGGNGRRFEDSAQTQLTPAGSLPVEALESVGAVMMRAPKFANSGLFARMGCVFYPVRATLDNVNLHHGDCVVFDFEIGELDVSPSREELEWTKKTTAAIHARTTRFSSALLQAAHKEIKAQPTLNEALQRYNELRVTVRGLFSDGARYRGYRLSYRGVEVKVATLLPRGAYLSTASASRRFQLTDGGRFFTERQRYVHGFCFITGGEKVYVQIGAVKNSSRRITKHLSAQGIGGGVNVWLVRLPEDTPIEDLKRLWIAAGRPDYTVVNDLPDAPAERTRSTSSEAGMLPAYVQVNASSSKLEKREVARNEDDDVIYWTYSRSIDTYNTGEQMAALRHYYPQHRFIALSESQAKRVRSLKTWTPVEEAVKDTLPEDLRPALAVAMFQGNDICEYIGKHGIAEKFPRLQWLMAVYEAAKDRVTTYQHTLRLGRAFGKVSYYESRSCPVKETLAALGEDESLKAVRWLAENRAPAEVLHLLVK